MNTNQSTLASEEANTRRPGSLLLWLATAILLYEFLSGIALQVLPFSAFAQYSLIIHTLIGLLSLLPLLWIVGAHGKAALSKSAARVSSGAMLAVLALIACVLTGLVATWQSVYGIRVDNFSRLAHLLTGLVFGTLGMRHVLSPLIRNSESRRIPAIATTVPVLLLFLATGALARLVLPPENYQAFPDQYDWPYGDDHPFWPSRAGVADAPWQGQFVSRLATVVNNDTREDFATSLVAPHDTGIKNLSADLATKHELDEDQARRVADIAALAVDDLHQNGALRPESMTGSASCGSSGCHTTIYNEWQASAHGFAAVDVLFTRVQRLLADTEGVAKTRACAGCHDPVALLSGTRFGAASAGAALQTFEGNSCLVCHRTIRTDTNGNGGFVIRPPRRYLFESTDHGPASLLNKFLIRSYPQPHIKEYKRPLYKSSDFCAACHKQVPAIASKTTAGLAQEQNEFDSWRNGRWYHGADSPRTIECRECHMPLVASDDPASGDDVDPYRSVSDGKHRSHRVLASNMYIPITMDLPGAEEQARQTISWLRGEIDIPEIEHKWTSGPVVELTIDAPDEIQPGELVNIKLNLHNNKTGHDFPAGPLDVLESWIELTVQDNLGNTLLTLGAENSVDPSIDAPIVYKADWYDRQGLPVQRHNLWDVVGASYKRVIGSGGSDIIDVPFRCPGIARPRLSESASETGPGERTSDVVFAINNLEFTELRIKARLLFRKANPEFLANVYEFETVAQAPVIELTTADHIIRVGESTLGN